MFKDEYKKALNKLHPDKEIKENIEKLLEEDAEKVIKVTIPYKRIIAAVATFAVVLGAVYFGTKEPTTPTTIKGETSAISEPKKTDIGTGYKKLYKVLNNIKERDIQLYATDKGTGDLVEDFVDEDFEENLGADDVMVQSAPSAATGENKGSVTQQSGTADKNDSGDSKEYSSTNTQFEDVDEADVVKTDGKYIYVCENSYKNGGVINQVNIYKAAGANTQKVKTLNIENMHSQDNRCNLDEMYVNNNRLITIMSISLSDNYGVVNQATQYTVYDTSTPEFKLIGYGVQEGGYCSSRMQGGKLYIVTNKHIKVADISKNDISTYVPACYVGEDKNYIKSSCIIAPTNPDSSSMLVVGSYNAKTASQISSVAVLGGGNNVYMDSENLIVSEYQYPFFDTKSRVDTTDLLLFKINDGKIEYKRTGRVKGNLLNQFSMDVYKGYLRVCTTVTHKNVNEVNKGDYIYTYNDTTTTNSLYVLSIDEMGTVGSIENLAEDERIYSARFTGDIGYFVTFRETDPLFAVDLKNPKKPKILSALKIDGFSSYLHPFGDGKLLGFGYNTENSITTSLKLTMFDTTDPTDVREIITETIVDGYAPGSNEHKALFVDVEKGWFGFNLLNHNSLANTDNSEYRIYEYKNDKFKLVANLKMPYEYQTRGLYIGDNFYVCSEKYIKVYRMSDFTKIADINEG